MSDATLFKTITISHIKEEVKGVKVFYFDHEDAQAINYKAGQYLTFVNNEKDQEIRRSYSITSAPVLNEPLAVGVKRIDNGFFSRLLVDHAKEGDKLTTTGAAGFFTLPDSMHAHQQLFFFAAGSGITPIFSLIKAALYQYNYTTIILIYSNASKAETIFYKELEELQSLSPHRLHVEYLFSNSADLTKARLHADLLRHFLVQHIKASKEDVLFYICGPTNYMRLCTYILQQEGVSPDHIKKENFNIDKVIIKAQPPDKTAHQVLIEFKSKTYQLTVQYPDNILSAAKKEGISLPYSCEAGRCGSCAAKCIQGKIWMANNEVLTDKEVAEGYILTCVGYPVAGNAVIKIA